MWGIIMAAGKTMDTIKNNNIVVYGGAALVVKEDLFLKSFVAGAGWPEVKTSISNFQDSFSY